MHEKYLEQSLLYYKYIFAIIITPEKILGGLNGTNLAGTVCIYPHTYASVIRFHLNCSGV